MLEYVTLTTLPVPLKSVLIRSPLLELVTIESVNLWVVRIRKRLDKGEILPFKNLQNVGDVMSGTRAATSDREPVTPRAEDVADGDVCGVRNDDAVVLIPDLAVLDEQIDAVAHVESISVVCCGQTIADGVGGVAEGVVDDDVPDGGVKDSGNVDPMSGRVFNVQIPHD